MTKKKEEPKICYNCGHCIYIGEGDYICDSDNEPIIVMEEHIPNENYYCCGGADWEEE